MGYGLYSGFGWNPYYGDPMGSLLRRLRRRGGSSTSYNRGEQGNLKLKVKPRTAKVYVDGYFVGTVDEFDGSFQKLALNTGRHKVEVKADGFETAEFDVLINAAADRHVPGRAETNSVIADCRLKTEDWRGRW